MKELGLIICDSNSPNELNFKFEVRPEAEVMAGNFVKVPTKNGFVLGKVSSISSYNRYYSDQRFINSHMRDGISIEERLPVSVHGWKIASVKVLGVWKDHNWMPPRSALDPGLSVEEADPELLASFLGIDNDKSVFVGVLFNNSKVKITLDLDKLIRHHIAVLGSTGSGKSYTCGVLIEELLDCGIPVVVVDAHGEYRYMTNSNALLSQKEMQIFQIMPKGYKVKILTPPVKASQADKPLTFDIHELSTDILSELAGINTEQQYDLLCITMETLRERKEVFSIDDIIQMIDQVGSEWNFFTSTITTVKRKLLLIKSFKIFGHSLSPEQLVTKGQLSIVDLSSDLDERVRRALIAATLNKLFESRKNNKIPPLLIIVEEAHRWAPQDEETVSKYMIRRLVREGRKFGIGVCVTSQRIVGLDKDVLSQCNTKITLRIDSKTDLDYVKPYLGFGSSQEFKMVPLLQNGVAVISGISVKTPLIVKIRSRKSRHGGEGENI